MSAPAAPASIQAKVLVTGAAGQIGGVGFKIVKLLRTRGLPVRALVHRLDQRSEALAQLGAEVVAGDLTDLVDCTRALEGCRRVFFSLSVSPAYLEATVAFAAVAKAQHPPLEVLVNMSQMTVSQMSLTASTSSPQHKLHFLAEQVLNWTGLPVVHVRPTVFLEHPFFHLLAIDSIRTSGELRLPFGAGRTSPIATEDIARVVVEILCTPAPPPAGRVYELTGPRSLDMHAVAAEYAQALGRAVKYVDVDPEQWATRELHAKGLPAHVEAHFVTMAHLHREGRYDRMVPTVEQLTGRPATSVRQWVEEHRADFQ